MVTNTRPFMALCKGHKWPYFEIKIEPYMNARHTLAKNLVALMEKFPEIGSQKLLFKATGVTTSTVGRIRRAEVSATIDNIESLARAFKITPAALLDPRLIERLGSNSDLLTRSAALANEIQEANLTDAQITILANTLAAMRSQ